MTLTISLPPTAAQRLEAFARQAKKTPEEYAAEILELYLREELDRRAAIQRAKMQGLY